MPGQSRHFSSSSTSPTAGIAMVDLPGFKTPWRVPGVVHSGFALLRMVMGVGLGITLTFYFSRFHVYTNRLGIPEWFGSWLWTYGICYGLLRYLEWSLMAYGVSGWTLPFSGRAISWTLGGILLSFLTDWIGFALALRIVCGIC